MLKASLTTAGFRASALRAVVFALLVAVCVVASRSALAAPPKSGQKAADTNQYVAMEIAKRGKITIQLLPQAAPKTVAHFLELVDKKFYDGILFHRYVEGFVVQGGDPESKKVKGEDIADLPSDQVSTRFGLGNGGSGTTVPLEAKAPHDRGTVGLARSAEPDSGDSQFFFNLVDNHRLDDGYCVFGKVVSGLDVMDKIRQGDKITSVRVSKAPEKPEKKKGRK